MSPAAAPAPSPPAPLEAGAAVTVAVLVRRELIRFVRQPARIAAAVGTPCLLWVFLASGFAQALRPHHLGELSYAAFLLPGMMTLVAVFAAIFASISIIEDRQGGWLPALVVSPVPRWAIAAGRVAGGALPAWLQGAVLLPAAPLLGIDLSAAAVLASLAGLALTSIAMTAAGVAFAWRMETAGAFHAVMNLIFAPLWLLSGAVFPPQGAAPWLAKLVALNPLAWCTQAIRGPLAREAWLAPLGASAVFALLALAAATWVVARPGRA